MTSCNRMTRAKKNINFCLTLSGGEKLVNRLMNGRTIYATDVTIVERIVVTMLRLSEVG